MKHSQHKVCVGLLTLLISTAVCAEIAAPMIPTSPEIISTSQLRSPPINIFNEPYGAILCVAQKSGRINIYGETGVEDAHGVWYYTDYCGSMGVIHGSQFTSPG